MLRGIPTPVLIVAAIALLIGSGWLRIRSA